MARPNLSRKPSFFWQGLLILLPVAVLAVVSLASLRQDEQAVERESRRRAAENVQSLARAMVSTVNDDLHQFLTLQNVWLLELRLAGQVTVLHTNRAAGEGFPDAKLAAEINRWQQSYPEFKPADFVPVGYLLTDGRQIAPPDFPNVPVPPKWFRELSPKQKELWQALRLAKANQANSGNLMKAQLAFLEAATTEAAKEAADYAIKTPEEIINHSGLVQSETGIMFQDLACYRLLTDKTAALTNPLMRLIWRQTFEHPSLVSPTLLTLAEGLTNRADAVVQDQVHWMRQYWNSQEGARGWLQSARGQADSKDWKSARWSHWLASASGQALGIFQPTTFENMGHDSEGVPFAGHGYTVWLVPRPVMEAIFAKALTQNKFLIPEYAAAAVTVEGMPLRQEDNSANREAKALLGTATQPFGKLSEMDAGNFEVRFYLTRRELMLAAVQKRAKIFEALLVGTILAALVGLLAAWRAFHRQIQLNEMKSNFVSSVSHELRAPIASVRLMAEGLERGKIQDPQKQYEYFRFITQECRRLSALIENVLDFSRIERGRKQYEPESTDLVALTEQTVRLMQTYAAEQQIQIAFQLNGPPAPVEVDGKAIQQALVNLIDNALKHSPKESTIVVGLDFASPSSVSNLQAVPKGKHAQAWTPNEKAWHTTRNTQSVSSPVQLWVEDKGEGIPAAEQEKIFERFYRIGSELRRHTQGVGIGLSIVKHIVEAHGGKILVRSAVGEGSRFTIILP